MAILATDDPRSKDAWYRAHQRRKAESLTQGTCAPANQANGLAPTMAPKQNSGDPKVTADLVIHGWS